jgi:hypothetical protein
LSALIQKLKVHQFVAGEVGITWEAIDAPQDFQFFIERSGSPEGPFETINSLAICHAYGYIDRTFNLESVNRYVYYRIRGVRGDETIFSELRELSQENPNYMGLSIARNKQLLLRRFNGTKCYVFIRKTFGPKCKLCYDPVRQKSTSSYCPACFGTTFEGGYFAPILIYIYLEHLNKANFKTDLQNLENLRIENNWCGNFPLFAPGDLIIRAKDEAVRYVIDSPVSHTEQNDVVVEQRFPVTQINLSRIEMKVPVPPNVYSIDDVNIYRRDYT